MIEDFSDFEEKYVKNISPSFLGLFFGEIATLVIILIIIFLIETILVLVLSYELKLLFILFALALYFLYWYSKRKIPKFKSDENGILFAFNKIDIKTKGELDILYKKVISNIESENLESKIKVVILPEHISILSLEKSKEIRENSGAKVVIWGGVESGTINPQKKALFISPTIRFTYETRIRREKIPFFNQNISNVVLDKTWVIDEKEQKIGRDYLSKNIKIFSLYLIGWTLILSNSKSERENGNKILQQILKEYKERNNLNNDEKLMVSNIEGQIVLYYNEKIRDMNFRFMDKSNKEKIQKGRKLLSVAVGGGVDKDKYLLFECILDFLENQPKEILIEKLKKEIESTNGKDAPVFYSLAFVEYYDGDIEKGFKYLKKAIKLVTPVDQMSSIVGWYQEALFEKSDKKYLNFPIGQIYYNLLEQADPERKIAKESLSQFVSDYKENKDTVIIEGVNEANRMLNKIKP